VNTLDELRARYGRFSDRDLELLLTADGGGLTPEARQALGEEAARRGITSGTVVTPGVVPTRVDGRWHYPKARVGARFVAYIIDGFIGVMLPVMAAVIPLVSSHGKVTIANGILLGLSIIWAIYYSFTKDAYDNGKSIGKRTVGLMVVNISTNKPCTKGESALRALMLGVMSAIPFVGTLVEPLVLLVNQDGRRVGDMVAGTQVIEAKAYDPDRDASP
jgi:uncharacterized RDD family membrane protein YckC